MNGSLTNCLLMTGEPIVSNYRAGIHRVNISQCTVRRATNQT